MILTNARILTFDSTNRVIDSGEVHCGADTRVCRVSPCEHETNLDAAETSLCATSEVIDCRGKLLMPALINCHTHLYSTLARGMTLPGPPPRNFPQILKKLWWRLDRALNLEDVYYSALIGLIDSAKSGVATLIDHHSSPNACAGSLDQIAQAFHEVGLRGALCYETSDRNGPAKAEEGVRENVRFIEKARGDGMLGAAFGLHAAFTLGDRTLRRCVEANQSLHAGFHIHIAEDACDAGAVRRLRDHDVLDEKALAAHSIHVTAADRGILAQRHVNVIHNPQSNCNNAVGVADLPALIRKGVLVGLGSDGYSPRLWEEFKCACQMQKPAAGAAALLNNRTIVKKVFGMDVGRVEAGAKADLMLVDYFPPTPIDSSNLFSHLLFGIANAPVDSLMVNGRWVVRGKQCVTIDERLVAERAAAQARKLWDRL